MYQFGIARFMFMTLFRSFSFVLGAVMVFLIKQRMERKEYGIREEMVSVKSRQPVRSRSRNYGEAHTFVDGRPSN